LVTLVALAAVAAGIGLFLADRTMTRRVDAAGSPVTLRDDAQAIKRGRYLYMPRGCADCHGADGAGRVSIDDPCRHPIEGPRLTGALGSGVVHYQPADWVRSIRHGVAPDGRALMVMPGEDYIRFTDDD